jgi:hypothetical protein
LMIWVGIVLFLAVGLGYLKVRRQRRAGHAH